MYDTHKANETLTDKLTGAKYCKCIQCGQIVIYDDPWQNMACQNGEMQQLRERLKNQA